MTKESKLMKNTAIIALGNVTTKAVSFFLLPLYTALLSTEEYGTVSLISVYVMLLSALLTAQFEQGLFRHLVDVRGEPEKQKRYVTTAFVTVLVVNAVFFLAALPVLELLHYPYTFYLLVNTLANVLISMLLQTARGLGDNGTYAAGSCVSGSLNVAFNVLFIAVWHWNVRGMLLATILSLLSASVFVLIRLKIWRYLALRHFGKAELSDLTKYSMPLIPYTLCWWAINVSDRMIINYSLGAGPNGVYSVAYKFPSVFTMSTNIFQTSWMESASENQMDDGRNRYYQSVVDKATRFYSSCNLLIIAALPFVFGYLINANFAEAYSFIPILMTAALFQSVSSLYGSIYFAFKETKRASKTNVLATVLNVAVNLLLIRSIGLYAAAISTLIAYVVTVVIRYLDTRKMCGLTLNKPYLLTETLAYVLVFLCYYGHSTLLKGLALALAVPYCLWQNRETLRDMLRVARVKLKKARQPMGGNT